MPVKCTILKTLFFCGLLAKGYGQTNPVPPVLRSLNDSIFSAACLPSGKGQLISHRAMNLYLADRIGYYLSHYRDLSLYKNSVVIDGYDQSIAINHHLYTANEKDERLRSMFTVGAKATAKHEFGFLFRHTWFGRSQVNYSGCEPGTMGNRQEMDAQRAILLHRLEAASAEEVAAFNRQLATMQQAEVPGQDLDSVKNNLRKEFASTLTGRYREKWFVSQADTFRFKKPFRSFRFNWTDVHLYLPVVNQQFYLDNTAAGTMEKKNPWLWEIAATHNRMIESTKLGRVLLQVCATAGQNNAARTGMIVQTGKSGEYPVYGSSGYQQFLAASLGARIVYIPPDWHFGLSGSFRQNIGQYHALDLVAGFPIVLIDSNGSPKINFEFQWRFLNINKTALSTGSGSVVNVTAGIPFGSVVH
jgi:hypothetical protein